MKHLIYSLLTFSLISCTISNNEKESITIVDEDYKEITQNEYSWNFNKKHKVLYKMIIKTKVYTNIADSLRVFADVVSTSDLELDIDRKEGIGTIYILKNNVQRYYPDSLQSLNNIKTKMTTIYPNGKLQSKNSINTISFPIPVSDLLKTKTDSIPISFLVKSAGETIDKTKGYNYLKAIDVKNDELNCSGDLLASQSYVFQGNEFLDSYFGKANYIFDLKNKVYKKSSYNLTQIRTSKQNPDDITLKMEIDCVIELQ